jgi:hypothetical protein
LALLYSEALVKVAAIANITRVYKTKVKASPYKVPFGIDLLGFFKSPDMLAPLPYVSIIPSGLQQRIAYAKIPPVAGNKIPKRS